MQTHRAATQTSSSSSAVCDRASGATRVSKAAVLSEFDPLAASNHAIAPLPTTSMTTTTSTSTTTSTTTTTTTTNPRPAAALFAPTARPAPLAPLSAAGARASGIAPGSSVATRRVVHHGADSSHPTMMTPTTSSLAPYSADARAMLADADFVLAAGPLHPDSARSSTAMLPCRPGSPAASAAAAAAAAAASITASITLCRSICVRCGRCQCFAGASGESIAQLEALSRDALNSSNLNATSSSSSSSSPLTTPTRTRVASSNGAQLPLGDALLAGITSLTGSFGRLFANQPATAESLLAELRANSPVTAMSRQFDSGQLSVEPDYDQYDPNNDAKTAQRKKFKQRFGFDTTDEDEGASFFKTKFLFLNNAANEQIFRLNADPVMDAALFDIINKRAADSAVSAASRYPQDASLFTPTDLTVNAGGVFSSSAFQRFVSSIFTSRNVATDPNVLRNRYYYHRGRAPGIHSGDLTVDGGANRCQCFTDSGQQQQQLGSKDQSQTDLMQFESTKSSPSRRRGTPNGGLIQVQDAQFSLSSGQQPWKSVSRVSSNIMDKTSDTDSQARRSVVSTATEVIALQVMDSSSRAGNSPSHSRQGSTDVAIPNIPIELTMAGKALSDVSLLSNDQLTNCEIGGIYRRKLVRVSKARSKGKQQQSNKPSLDGLGASASMPHGLYTSVKSPFRDLGTSILSNPRSQSSSPIRTTVDDLLNFDAQSIASSASASTDIAQSRYTPSTVRSGSTEQDDSLASISIYYSVSVYELKNVNKIWDDKDLFFRDYIDIPINVKNRDIILREMQSQL